MNNLKQNCKCCQLEKERMIAENILSLFCPACGKLLKLMEFGMRRGLTLGEVVVGLFIGFVAYEALKSP